MLKAHRLRINGRITRNGLVLLAAAGLLTAVWWRLPTASPPVYDGVCIANPYLSLNPPAGGPAASSATHTVAMQGGNVPQSLAATNEFPPQAQLSTDDGSVIPPPGATAITLSIDPVPPPATLPQDGQVHSNFYKFSATANTGAPATLNPAKPVTITLRPKEVSGQPETIERLDGGHWTALQTSLGSCSIYYSANSTALGMFVLVGSGTSSSGPTPVDGGSASSGFNPIGILIAAVVLLGVALILLRLSRSRGARAPESKRPPPTRRM